MFGFISKIADAYSVHNAALAEADVRIERDRIAELKRTGGPKRINPEELLGDLIIPQSFYDNREPVYEPAYAPEPQMGLLGKAILYGSAFAYGVESSREKRAVERERERTAEFQKEMLRLARQKQ